MSAGQGEKLCGPSAEGKGGGALGRANGPGRERKKIARWKSWAAGSDFQGLLPFFFLFFFFNSFFQKSF